MLRCAWCLAWLLTASITFLLIGGIVAGLPPWLLGRAEFVVLGFACAAFICSTAIPLAMASAALRPHWGCMVAGCGVAFAGVWGFVQLVGAEWPVSLAVAMGSVAIFILLCFSPAGPGRFRRLGWMAIASAVIASLSLPATLSSWIYRGLEKPFSYVVDTSLHRVRINLFREHVPRPQVHGGGLAVVGEQLILVTGDGLFYLLEFSHDGERLDARPLGITAPMNSAEFRALPYESFKSELFHTIAVLVLEGAAPGEIRILVSHHYWQADKACYVERVSFLVTSLPDLLAGRTRDDWQTLYDTVPCLTLDKQANHKFMGHQSGGRMIQTDPQHILLSVGDFALDGFYSKLKASQDMSMAYGKTIEINLATGTSRVFTSGHRNPQGLHRDAKGRIWMTEHGPKGGDELNLLDYGNNYGWPLVTLGAEYNSFSWPGSERSDLHPEFTGPSFAWTPSIATSNLTSVEGGDFERWQGDLIVSSLIARSLYRVHFEHDEPVLAEPIPVQERVRDIVRDSRGRIIFWTDRAAIGFLARAAEDD